MKNEGKGTESRYGAVNFEKRRHPRFNVDLPVEYSQIDSPTRHTGKALNISEGGLLIYFPEQMDVSQYLRLKFHFISGSEMNAIETLVEVVWMGVHKAGVRFVDISPEDMVKLKKFLKGLSG